MSVCENKLDKRKAVLIEPPLLLQMSRQSVRLRNSGWSQT